MALAMLFAMFSRSSRSTWNHLGLNMYPVSIFAQGLVSLMVKLRHVEALQVATAVACVECGFLTGIESR